MMKQQRFIVIKFGLEYLFFRNSVQQNGKYILCTCFLLERMTDNYGYSDLNKSKKSDFPGGSDGEASVYNAGDLGLIPGSGRSSGEGNGNPLQYSCLENPMDGGDWWVIIHRVAESDTTEQLHFHFFKKMTVAAGMP